MSQTTAECSACGNEWELSKPLEEIDRLRCSGCGKTGEKIEVRRSGSDEREGGRSVVERIDLEERHTDLRKRADRVADRIVELGGSKVPDELEPSYRRLTALSDELSGDGLLSSSELDEVAEFVVEKENELDDLDVVEEIGDLEARVDELEQKIEELEQRKREILNFIGGARTFLR